MKQETQGLEVIRLYRLNGESKVKAFADIAMGNFIVKGLRVLDGKNGLFLAMPQEKAKDGKWYNTFYAKTKEAKQELANLVLAAYEEG